LIAEFTLGEIWKRQESKMMLVVPMILPSMILHARGTSTFVPGYMYNGETVTLGYRVRPRQFAAFYKFAASSSSKNLQRWGRLVLWGKPCSSALSNTLDKSQLRNGNA
jgi:hypothetical protein